MQFEKAAGRVSSADFAREDLWGIVASKIVELNDHVSEEDVSGIVIRRAHQTGHPSHSYIPSAWIVHGQTRKCK